MATIWSFEDTTQRQNWMFSSPEELMKFRREANEKVQSIPGITVENRITVEDEMRLKNYYQSKIIDSCNTLNYSRRVQATAIIYFKRFFLRNSILSYDPKLVIVFFDSPDLYSLLFIALCMTLVLGTLLLITQSLTPSRLTCIYIACKTEEQRRAVEEIAGAGKTDAPTIINMEITVLAGITFHLMILHPYRSLRGFLEEIKKIEFNQDWISVDSEAQAWVTQSLLTDSVFLFTPGQIALGALWKATGVGGRQEQRDAFLRFLNQTLGVDPRFQELKLIISEKIQPYLEGGEVVETKQAGMIDRKMRSSPANQYQQPQRKKKKKTTSSTSSSSSSSSSSRSTLHAIPPSDLQTPLPSKV